MSEWAFYSPVGSKNVYDFHCVSVARSTDIKSVPIILLSLWAEDTSAGAKDEATTCSIIVAASSGPTEFIRIRWALEYAGDADNEMYWRQRTSGDYYLAQFHLLPLISAATFNRDDIGAPKLWYGCWSRVCAFSESLKRGVPSF